MSQHQHLCHLIHPQLSAKPRIRAAVFAISKEKANLRNLIAFAQYYYSKHINDRDEQTFADEFLYKPIAIQIRAFLSHLRSLRGHFLSNQIPANIKHAIVMAPFIENNLWNIDSTCEK